MKIVIIDNYDSFTFNLAGYLRQLGCEVDVFRNDKFQLSQLQSYRKIILSPGPGIPQEAGLLLDVIKTYAPEKQILGVCLGHQAIGEVFGAKLKNLSDVYHGVQTTITHYSNDYIFNNLETRLDVGRYHSWVVDNEDLPSSLIVTAKSDDGCIMGIKHIEYDVHGIQFHLESVLTPKGKDMLENFISKN